VGRLVDNSLGGLAGFLRAPQHKIQDGTHRAQAMVEVATRADDFAIAEALTAAAANLRKLTA
jgi:hypothetical protein